MEVIINILILSIVFVILKFIMGSNIIEPFTQKKYKLCIMAIFKNEETYMEEWLKYHLGHGISHFYLYCNDPNLNKYKYFDKYRDKITIIPWLDKKNMGLNTVQRQAYSDCVKKYSTQCDYIMMLDIDEFLAPLDEKVKVIDIIAKYNVNSTKAFKIMRFNYGSGGHIKRPKGKVMDNYLKHEMLCSTYKTIANTDYIDVNRNFYGVHDFPYKNIDGKVYNSNFSYKTGLPNGCEDNKTEVPLIIKHYYMKSKEEYIERCKLWEDGGINNFGYRNNCEKNFENKDRNINQIIGYRYLRDK